LPPDVYAHFCTTGELPASRPSTGRLTRADAYTPNPPAPAYTPGNQTVATPSPTPRTDSWTSRSSGTWMSRAEIPQVGSLVGPYRLEGELGKGGMGAVYRGRHGTTGAIAAVKVLLKKPGSQVEERFEREVQAFAKLRHPNVVAIHETGEAASYLWYAME